MRGMTDTGQPPVGVWLAACEGGQGCRRGVPAVGSPCPSATPWPPNACGPAAGSPCASIECYICVHGRCHGNLRFATPAGVRNVYVKHDRRLMVEAWQGQWSVDTLLTQRGADMLRSFLRGAGIDAARVELVSYSDGLFGVGAEFRGRTLRVDSGTGGEAGPREPAPAP